MRGRVLPALLCLTALLLVACGSDPPSGVIRASSGESLAEKGLYAACGGSRFDAVPPDTSAMPGFDAWTDLDLSNLGGERPYFLEFVAGYDWVITQDTGEERSLFGSPPSAGGRDPMYAYAALEVRDGAWAPVGWGDCRIELEAEGWGNARFTIDPSTPPDPNATTISVLANEMSCASGMAPTDREVRAVVLDDDLDTVSIVILVEPTSGASNCPSNPDFPFEVELPSALGDREILDASTSPPQTVWPD